MKKLFGLIFLILSWCNIGSSVASEKFTVSLRCYETTLWMYTLDIDKENNTYGNVLNYNTYDGEKKPELTLVITAEDTDGLARWKGEILLVNHNGKEEYKLTKIERGGANFSALYAGQIKSNGDLRGLKLTQEITFNSQYDDDPKKDIYYELELTYFSGIKSLKNKKKIFDNYDSNQFKTFSNKLFCFK